MKISTDDCVHSPVAEMDGVRIAKFLNRSRPTDGNFYSSYKVMTQPFENSKQQRSSTDVTKDFIGTLQREMKTLRKIPF